MPSRLSCRRVQSTLGLAALLATPAIAANAADSSVKAVLTVTEPNSATLLPCRVHLKDPAGKPVQAPGLPFWRDHFVCDGRVELSLAPAEYAYEIERGPEYESARGEFSVAANKATDVKVKLARITDLASEGWWSGETHVHRPLAEVERLMRAEDLHIAVAITWWNRQNPWKGQAVPNQPVKRFDTNRLLDVLGGEDERGGGALLFTHLARPLEIAHSEREWPPSVKWLNEGKAAGAWVDVEKPFWWDFPAWLATGKVDSIGIANNHQNRGGMLDNEAWGKTRDRDRYPGPRGNGEWTQDIYYHALNCGIRIPPSAGSASGVLPNPVGYNRVYAHVDGDLTWEKWWAAVRAGQVFVTNGPLLRLRANGELPGHVFKSPVPLPIEIAGKLDSREPIATVELVRNGKAAPITIPGKFTVSESGWFLVRARADVASTFRFAFTGPFYVEIGGKAMAPTKSSAEFFLHWVRERREQIRIDDAKKQAEAIAPWNQAEEFWSAIVSRAEAR